MNKKENNMENALDPKPQKFIFWSQIFWPHNSYKWIYLIWIIFHTTWIFDRAHKKREEFDYVQLVLKKQEQNLFTVKSGWLPSFEYESLLSETDDNVSPVTVSCEL